MKKTHIGMIITVAMSVGVGGFFMLEQLNLFGGKTMEFTNEKIRLPKPNFNSNTSVEQALLKRRSVRVYKYESLRLNELSQLLWAAQGITDQRGFRTAPSAGALYPLELYVVAGNVDDLPDGIYKYNPHKHELVMVIKGDKRVEVCKAAFSQTSIKNAPAAIVFSAVYERTTRRYGERGIRYVHMEVGHAAQNIHLQAVSLNLGVVMIGAFDDEEVKKIMNMGNKEQPLYIIPVGRV
ncbi:MAG: SagB/ThcOx family dehydrogenase [Elusimicrobiales bacterium]